MRPSSNCWLETNNTRLLRCADSLLYHRNMELISLENSAEWLPFALYNPTSGGNALQKGRYLPPKMMGVVTLT
jgi:hypothetical protein